MTEMHICEYLKLCWAKQAVHIWKHVAVGIVVQGRRYHFIFFFSILSFLLHLPLRPLGPFLSLPCFCSLPLSVAEQAPMAKMDQYASMDPYSRSRYDQGIDSKIVIMGNSGLFMPPYNAYPHRSRPLQASGKPVYSSDIPKTSLIPRIRLLRAALSL